MATPKVSIVVSSFGRDGYLAALLNSVRDHFPWGSFEIITVCSDDPNSSKVLALKLQESRSNGTMKYIQADVRTTHRLRSLYYYENLGIKAATGEWIFVTNDDTRFDGPFYEELLRIENDYDAILVKGHIGEPGLGKRIPPIGILNKPLFSAPRPLYLYDFSVIRKIVYENIGYLDENLDWFGKGFDLALAVEFRTNARICHSSDLEIGHDIASENRTPPDYRHDFVYARDKWTKWCAENPGYSFEWPW